MNTPFLQQKFFLLLLAIVSVAFVWILLPFYGAVFWGVVLSILFAPVNRRLLRAMPQRRNLAAAVTLLVVLLIVVLPSTVIVSLLVQEATMVYQRIQSGDLNFGQAFQQIMSALPVSITSVLERFGITSLSEMQAKLATSLTQGSQMIASRALNFGQNTFEFLVGFAIMLYLLFFLLRDGATLSQKIRIAIPLQESHKRHLLGKFTTVTRATVKGNIIVAAVQGLIGGLTFWGLGIHAPVLWGVLMAFLSLLPAVGAGLVWGPVAIYFLVTGAIWQGVVLILVGTLVIGLVDNILRPILVGKDTRMPDYVILISTLGGMALFGLNGFVIGPVIAALFIAAWDLFVSTREAAPEAAEQVALPNVTPPAAAPDVAGAPPPARPREL